MEASSAVYAFLKAEVNTSAGRTEPKTSALQECYPITDGGALSA